MLPFVLRALIALAPASAVAAPLTLLHQVRLTDPTGAVVQGSHDVTVSLYRDATSTAPGDRLWTRTFTATSVEDGYLSLRLDAVDSAWFSGDVFVGVKLDTQAEMAPRTLLADAPTAGWAEAAGTATTATTATTALTATTTERIRVEGAASGTTCTASGALVFDTSTNGLRVCNGSIWVNLQATLGSPGNPALSCRQLNLTQPGFGDAVYWLDPDGTGPVPAFQAPCKMSGTYGGGWTLVARFRNGCMTDSRDAVGTLTSESQATCAKLSDAQINALRTSSGSEGVFWGWQDSSAYAMPKPRFLKIISGEFNASDTQSGLTQQCSCAPGGPWSGTYGYHSTMAGVYNHSASAWMCVTSGQTGCDGSSGTSALFLYQHALHQAGTFPSNSHGISGGSNGYLYVR